MSQKVQKVFQSTKACRITYTIQKQKEGEVTNFHYFRKFSIFMLNDKKNTVKRTLQQW